MPKSTSKGKCSKRKSPTDLADKPRSLKYQCNELLNCLAAHTLESQPWNIPTLSTKSAIGYYDFASPADSSIARRHNCRSLGAVLAAQNVGKIELDVHFLSRNSTTAKKHATISSGIRLQDLLLTSEACRVFATTNENSNAEDAAQMIRHAPHLLHGSTLLVLLTLLPAAEIARLAHAISAEVTAETLEERKREAILEVELYRAWEKNLNLREWDFDRLAGALRNGEVGEEDQNATENQQEMGKGAEVWKTKKRLRKRGEGKESGHQDDDAEGKVVKKLRKSARLGGGD